MSLLALQDLFRRYREKATGVWKLGEEPGRVVFIDYGDTVFAQSTHLQDRLTYLLVERGKLTQAQMDYALANLKNGISIGRNLIEMGFITQRDLLEVAKAQVERIVKGALTCPDVQPTFEPRELDSNVVRLPMNTPQLFLAATLSLQDREGLLELLGPLNQVVVLQGRSLMDLSLPADLAKLPPLLDGTHTLLELSRESMAEPLRLGAFALFLREMGWARLHEMPPLDRHALDLAFAPEPEALSPLLPDAIPETVPSLFSTIQEAARPTTNLEHLSLALDEELPELPEPAGGAAVLLSEPLSLPEPVEPEPEAGPPLRVDPEGPEATPAMALPPLSDEEDHPVHLVLPLEDPGQPRLIEPSLGFGDEPLERPEPGGAVPARGKGLRRTLLALLLLACLGAGGFLWHTRFARQPKPVQPAPVVVPVVPVVPPAPPVQPAAPAAPSGVAVPPVPVAVPEPKAEPPAPEPVEAAAPGPVSTSLAARLRALEEGDLGLAVRQGKRLVKGIPPSHWTLRLEIACQAETIRRVAEMFKGRQPDLFLLPMTLRDGRGCYQVLFGRFPSEQAAVKEMKRLPHAFLADRNRPKVFQFSDLPKKQ